MSDTRKFLTQNGLAVIVALVSIVLLVTAVVTGEFELLKFANKTLAVGLLLVGTALYSKYFRTKRYQTDEEITTSPVALAIHNAGIYIALGLCVALA